MKALNHPMSPRKAPRRLAALAVLLGSLASFAIAAGGGTTNSHDSSRSPVPPPPPMGNSTLASDTDEGIGTLPVIIDPDAGGDGSIADLLPERFLSPTGQVWPYVELTGTWADIESTVLEAGGKGVLIVQPTGGLDGEARFGFHGNVNLEIDIEQLRLRGLEPTIQTAGEFDGGMATVCWSSNCTSPSTLPPSTGLLNFGSLIDSGILQQSSVQLLAVSTVQSSATIDFTLLSDFQLQIVQRIQ